MAAPIMECDALYHCCDDYISNILVTYAPIPSGRIRVCIFASAGCQQYPRITLSPASPLFAAVKHLPREKQGDHLYQGLAVSILKYFAELSDTVKDALKSRYRTINGLGSTPLPTMFDEMHAAEIASNMVKVHHPQEIINDLEAAFSPRVVPSTNVDLMLPPDYFHTKSDAWASTDSLDTLYIQHRFGMYTEFIQQLGESIFVPNSKVRRSLSSSCSKDTTFPRAKKEAVRLAMCEMVDTEERYVSKLYDLVHNVVKDSRQKFKSEARSLSNPNEVDLEKLFPPCLDKILEVNTSFLQDIRKSIETTEADALADIAKGDDTIPPKNDPIGAVALGKVMRRWFPKFYEPYQEYWRLQPGMSSTMSWFMKNSTSSVSQRIQQTGERKLQSLLIEPVQRLPRYSLFIDTMTAKMPKSHPATKYLWRARDVISDICADGTTESVDKTQVHTRLCDQVDGWSSTYLPQGRLITVLDVEKLHAPYRLDLPFTLSEKHLIILFTDMLVVLEKPPKCWTTSQIFLSYMEKGSTFSLTQMDRPKTPPTKLRFAGCIHTQYIWASHSPGGQILYIASSEDKPSNDSKLRAFKLLPSEEPESKDDSNRAKNFCDEITKAKAEHRYSDQERTGHKWSLHSLQGPSSPTRFFTAICEEESEYSSDRKDFTPFRILFGKTRSGKPRVLNVDKNSAWVIAIISHVQDSNKYEIDITSIFGSNTVDIVKLEDMVSTISRRFSNLLPRLYSTDNNLLVGSIVMRNSQILDTVCSKGSRLRKGSKSLPSPTKILASILGSTKEHHRDKPEPQKHILDEPPTLQLSGGPLSTQPNVERSNSRVKLVGGDKQDPKQNNMERLEQTLTALILSLRARAGNILGKFLQNRDLAKPSAVTGLLDTLLKDPSNLQSAAEAPIDVLFSAFEYFIWTTWKVDIGPIMARHQASRIMLKFDTFSHPKQFEDFFKDWLTDLSPQNRRALTATVKLLADLLDASGNETDRQALIMAFAELLTAKCDTESFIPILNRLVEDYERLFDDRTVVGFPGQDYSPRNSISSHSSTTSGPDAPTKKSVGSTSSSFRRRFFGSGASGGKVSSLIRTLSKSRSPPGSRGGSRATKERQPPAPSSSSSSVPPLSSSSAAAANPSANNLEGLLKEAAAENDALYERFNAELARAARIVRGDGAVEELKRLLAATREELRREKREVWRLRREVAELKGGK